MTDEMPPPPSGPAAGHRLAGYRLGEELGRGGMAVVYLAHDDRLNRPVALKVLSAALAADDAFRQRFIQESRAAAAVDHPNIIPVFDAGEADGVLYLAMRYVPGGDVRTLLDRGGPLPAPRACALIAQVAAALDAAHGRGLIHRDVKPTNILLEPSATRSRPDHAYLSDFGLAKQSFAAVSLTATGQFLGTVDYVPPEQIEGYVLDGRADQYALACASFEMLSGWPPFKREQAMAVLSAQLSDPPPWLTALRPGLPPAVDQVLARALAKHPEDRFDRCLDFAEALLDACEPGSTAAAVLPPGAAGFPAAVPAPPSPRLPTEPAGQAALAGLAGSAGQGRPPGPAADSPTRELGGGYPLVIPASWSGGAPPPAPGLGGGPPPRRRRRAAALTAAVVAVLAAAGIAVALLRGPGAGSHRAAPPTAGGGRAANSAPASTPPALASSGPAATVQAYIAAINSHHYGLAWRLGGRSSGTSYANFVSGFGTTAHDDLVILSASGSDVSAAITAHQTDGSVRDYRGTYTVRHGVIVRSRVRQTG